MVLHRHLLTGGDRIRISFVNDQLVRRLHLSLAAVNQHGLRLLQSLAHELALLSLLPLGSLDAAADDCPDHEDKDDTHADHEPDEPSGPMIRALTENALAFLALVVELAVLAFAQIVVQLVRKTTVLTP